MTRPVKGFLTKRGRYFDKKIDAQTCDAIEDFNEGLNEYLSAYYIPPLVHEFIMGHMKYFLVANKEIVEPYIKLVTEVPNEPKPLEVPTGPVTVPLNDVPEDEPLLLDLPEDVNDFLPETNDETTSVDDDFTSAFFDPEGGSDDTSAGNEDVRHAGVPGEDPTE